MSRRGHRFFLDQTLSVGSRLTLPAHQSKQITNVLRLRPPDRVNLFNGDGNEYGAVVVAATRGAVVAEIVDSVSSIEPTWAHVELALAVIKSDRFEWALQKATELGVERIIPMTTEQSVISLRVDREGRRRERWLKIAIEASEQCGRRDVPMIEPVMSYADVLGRAGDARTVVMWEDERGRALPDLDLDESRPVRLVVGPEGGFTEDEIGLARRCGAAIASLGPLTLRSETAAVVSIAMLVARGISAST